MKVHKNTQFSNRTFEKSMENEKIVAQGTRNVRFCYRVVVITRNPIEIAIATSRTRKNHSSDRSKFDVGRPTRVTSLLVTCLFFVTRFYRATTDGQRFHVFFLDKRE